jgi:hypothetical protein
MEKEYVKKRWQNLIHKDCIKCDSPLTVEKDRVALYVCTNEECDFFITRRKLFEILTDDTHIMRRFITKEEAIKLEDAVNALLT